MKKTPLVFFQLRLLCRNDLLAFSPALNRYLALSKVMIIAGSVSELTVVSTEVDHVMAIDVVRGGREKALNTTEMGVAFTFDFQGGSSHAKKG